MFSVGQIANEYFILNCNSISNFYVYNFIMHSPYINAVLEGNKYFGFL